MYVYKYISESIDGCIWRYAQTDRQTHTDTRAHTQT